MAIELRKSLLIYTDASSHILPGGESYFGGWAFLAVTEEGEVLETRSGASRLKTGAAEVSGIAAALSFILANGYHNAFAEITVVCDSQYALSVLNAGLQGRRTRGSYQLLHRLCETVYKGAVKCSEGMAELGGVWVRGHQKEEDAKDAEGLRDIKNNALVDGMAGRAMRDFREVQEDYIEWKESQAAAKAAKKGVRP